MMRLFWAQRWIPTKKHDAGLCEKAWDSHSGSQYQHYRSEICAIYARFKYEV